MVSRTAAERKAFERFRREARGLKRFEFWLSPAVGEKVKRYVARLTRVVTKEKKS
jgi:hypothetical protein